MTTHNLLIKVTEDDDTKAVDIQVGDVSALNPLTVFQVAQALLAELPSEVRQVFQETMDAPTSIRTDLE